MASKTLTGTYDIAMTLPIPMPKELYTVTVCYYWYPTDFPAMKDRPMCGMVSFPVKGGYSVQEMIDIARKYIWDQEAIDGSEIVEDPLPIGVKADVLQQANQEAQQVLELLR